MWAKQINTWCSRNFDLPSTSSHFTKENLMTSKPNVATFVPTYLYIKQHKVTGKLYFGKTIKDPLTYTGSGKYWLRHISAHGKQQVETLWYCLYTDFQELSTFALSFSKMHDIVKSPNWANLMEENGRSGGAVENAYIKTFNKLPRTPEHAAHSGAARKGMYQNWKDPAKRLENVRIAMANAPLGTCPHCGLTKKMLGRFKLYHFDNCKSRQMQ